MKKFIKFLVVPMLLLTFVMPTSASAATYYQSNANQQQISYLYSLIAQLQAQLQALQNNGGYYGSASSNSYLSVQTDGVEDADGDAVELKGRVNFKRNSDARVWFEYGPTALLSYSTQSADVRGKSGGSTTFTLTSPDFDYNKTYFYRAVAEDANGGIVEGVTKSFRYDGRNSNSSNDDDDDNDDEDTPDVNTDGASDERYNSARLEGSVDMNDFENGYVFFVYGQDEDAVDDSADEDEYSDIDTDGDDIRKIVVDTNLDDDDDYNKVVTGLDEDTDYFFRICVEYDDEDDDVTLKCGDVEEFTTDEY